VFWPLQLCVFYPHPVGGLSWVQAAGAAALLATVTVVVVWLARRYPYLAVGWLWYLGTLVPVIGLVQVGGQARADRYTYVPLIGIFILVAWGGADLLARWPYRRGFLAFFAGPYPAVFFLFSRAPLPYFGKILAPWAPIL